MRADVAMHGGFRAMTMRSRSRDLHHDARINVRIARETGGDTATRSARKCQ
jgi:hypothetical protein